jgi:hypothetical protein
MEQLEPRSTVIQVIPNSRGGYDTLVSGEPLDIERGAAAVDAVMSKLTEGMSSVAEFAELQAAIVSRFAAPPTEGEQDGEQDGNDPGAAAPDSAGASPSDRESN